MNYNKTLHKLDTNYVVKKKTTVTSNVESGKF